MEAEKSVTAFPTVSLIIPTHNRRNELPRTLAALAAQTYPLEQLEVVIVADGCVDGTAEYLRTCTTPFKRQTLEQPGLGPAAARNYGSQMATGELLIFLDDDIEASPQFVQAHVTAHQTLWQQFPPLPETTGQPRSVVMGYLPLPPLVKPGYFQRSLRAWWDEQFFKMRQAGHRFGYNELFSGNFSLPADFFRQMGGFNTDLRCHEDYELGLRLLEAGAIFAFAAEAAGTHHDITDEKRAVKRRRAEGQADVYLAQKYPQLATRLPLHSGAHTLLSRGMRFLAFRAPAWGNDIAALLLVCLPVLEMLWIYPGWRYLFHHLLDYWYWQAVAAEVKTPKTFSALVAAQPTTPPDLTIELAQGLETAESRLSQYRPASVRLVLNGQLVADIPAEVGRERLHGGHLRHLLNTHLPWQTISALAAASDIPGRIPQTDLPKPSDRDMAAAWFVAAKKVVEVELSEPLPTIEMAGYTGLHLLVKNRGRVIGNVNLVGWEQRHVTAEILHQVIWQQLETEMMNQWAINVCSPIPAPNDPPITVVVCTRDRTQPLRHCLAALQTLDYPHYEVVVVDNAPSNEETRQLVMETAVTFASLRYVCEPRPGLDWARNRGIAEAQHDLVAFTDDDARPDARWLQAIARAFAEPEVMAVTGSVAAAELETPAQNLFEFVYGGMNHGFRRWFVRRAGLSAEQLFWASAFGVGANMAFRRSVFAQIGGFDVALDVGTPSGGGGDVEMFYRLVAQGHTLVYEPDALVWHTHRREEQDLVRLVYQNGRSFACYLLTCGRNGTDWGQLTGFVLRSWLWGWIGKRLIWPKSFPRWLIWQELKGVLSAPRAYRDTLRHAQNIRDNLL